jgi:hypothetical protein
MCLGLKIGSSEPVLPKSSGESIWSLGAGPPAVVILLDEWLISEFSAL